MENLMSNEVEFQSTEEKLKWMANYLYKSQCQKTLNPILKSKFDKLGINTIEGQYQSLRTRLTDIQIEKRFRILRDKVKLEGLDADIIL